MVRLIDIPDVDIELKDRSDVLDRLKHIPCSIHRSTQLEKHKSGVYFQNAPIDGVTHQCSLDHKRAEELGYVKLDLLHNHVYSKVRDPGHLRVLVAKEPNWELLTYKEVVNTLFQIHDHYEIIKELKPCSLPELAMTIAIIRPGKKHLIGRSWEGIEKEIWKKTDEGYFFKKSHAHAFAQVIMVQLNLLEEELNYE